MNFRLIITTLAAVLLLAACSEEKKDTPEIPDAPKPLASIDKSNSFIEEGASATLQFSVSPSRCDSFQLSIDGDIVSSGEVQSENMTYDWSTSGLKMGRRSIQLTVYPKDRQAQYFNTTRTIVPAQPPLQKTIKVVRKLPHDSESYTQGLEFDGNKLYEGTGQKGHSKIRLVNLETGEAIEETALEGRFFGEGITVLGDSIMQITYTSRTGFIYDKNTLEEITRFDFNSPTGQGWGLSHTNEHIIMSDGSHQLYFLNRKTMALDKTLEAYANTGPVSNLNELEVIDGKIYANVYQTDNIVVINPENGAVLEIVDLGNLKSELDSRAGIDVLNGIAYNKVTGKLYVTGKLWPNLFEIEITD